MKRSIMIIAVVVLAIAGVVIAKQGVRRDAALDEPAATSVESETRTAPAAPPEQTPAVPPPPAQPPAASDRQTPANPNPPPVRPPAADPDSEEAGDHDGPLPGSDLAACLASGRPTMADFGRTWCKPCKAMVPILKQAAKDYQGKAHVVFVDLGKYAKEGRDHRIKAMPTQIFFDGEGKEVERHIGFLGGEDITRKMEALGVPR